jgi:hypothetical protein
MADASFEAKTTASLFGTVLSRRSDGSRECYDASLLSISSRDKFIPKQLVTQIAQENPAGPIQSGLLKTFR